MTWLTPLLFAILAYAQMSHTRIADAKWGMMASFHEPHAEVKRQARATDIASLQNNPQIKALIERLPELLKNPKIQEILKNPKVQKILEPESLKKILNSGVIEKLMTPESIKQLQSTVQGQRLMQNEQLKQFVNSDMFKVYLAKLNEIMPQLITIMKGKVNELVALAKG